QVFVTQNISKEILQFDWAKHFAFPERSQAGRGNRVLSDIYGSLYQRIRVVAENIMAVVYLCLGGSTISATIVSLVLQSFRSI
ncbi:MAG: hypothetical protein QM296_09575, partial [Bacillota bacterium]|nr:hypothetical protein [Bacillota bacterium]